MPKHPKDFAYNGDHIPEHLHAGLLRYMNQHTEPGSFLRAALENNLKETFIQAGDSDATHILTLVAYLYNEMPGVMWGSKEKVEYWLTMIGAEREEWDDRVKQRDEWNISSDST